MTLSDLIVFSRNPSKRSGERFHIIWSVLWIAFFGFVVVSKWYENWKDEGYMLCGLALSVPNLLLPNLFPSQADKDLPWKSRFVTKAWVWVAIFNFIANYFFTQYFFVLLGCSYSFPITWTINRVPIALILITQSYFTTYFVLANMMIRKIRTVLRNSFGRFVFVSIGVIALSWFLAFMETWTIESVPYYSFQDRTQMYRVGLTFYALYFLPAFPMYYWMDEEEIWDFSYTLVNGLAAGMLAFILCDIWRLQIGSLVVMTPQYDAPYINQ